ncbi:MAG: tRNA (N6-threonylcarbamoyladenosine(37)-N6)-methyltransferase TrmO [Bacteroidetes bacterium]|nr:tRNA (N6-threonylcarbamoyladenosine(37)-N6)-methyltransferase TrmO [Bacteroidota bacterium]MBU1578612.1 tRNA (N6-threonylcarbamoyladenosine(37)-N6)-methyltransferase TrmO [Bacteroidota bacterium]MBU2558334.1 tRNA (N6-threonylcarbamoyladenosine(37)-N6)-methyltransferase TrmO [Bacteroidota bacterium]
MNSINIKPIGIIHTEYDGSKQAPIQPVFATNSLVSVAIINRELMEGLDGLDQFTHVILFYWLHKAKSPQLKQKPFLSDKEYGIFAIRSPHRPNPIGMSVVELVKIEENRLYFNHADMFDNSPLLDIKPFVPDMDNRPNAGMGWLKNKIQGFEP